MNSKRVVVFGYNTHSKEILEQMSSHEITVYCFSDDGLEDANSEGVDAKRASVDDDFRSLLSLDAEQTMLICTLQDEAQNLFLTISLRDLLPSIQIIALATTAENATKLRLAGASIAVAQIRNTANLIVYLLEYPAVSLFLENILDTTHELQVAELQESSLVGLDACKLDGLQSSGILPLAYIRAEDGKKFFTVESDSYILEHGDTLIVLAKYGSLKDFRDG